MTSPTSNRGWYLGAAAAAGALVAADADASIVLVPGGPWNDNPSNIPIDVIQGDDVDPILTFNDATRTFVSGAVSPSSGPGTGVLRLWIRGTASRVDRYGATTVGPGLSFYTSAANIAFQFAELYGGVPKNGAVVGSDNYVGFRIVDSDVNGGSPIYGWAQVDIPSIGLDAQILAVAYQDDGTGIVLGDTGIVIPEPSSLGLLALGATGLAALRRRKRSSDS